MEKQKFQIGEEVQVSFIGMIKQVYITNGKVYYIVDNGDTSALRVVESQITPLPQPEDEPGVKNGE
jgi:hypothetical protein